MKKIFKYSILLVAATMMLTSCSDDRDSNPTLKTPDSFVLNTPAYASQAIDLQNSETVNLTWSQPDYGGFPVATSYTVEFSGTNDWSVSNVEANADESGETIPTYYIVENSFTTCEAAIDAVTINKALIQMMGYVQGEVPETQKLYARVWAQTKGAKDIVSNVVELLVAPYYIELKPADPVLWYMVGNCIGSNDWDNGSGSVGTGLIPLLPMPDADVDGNGNTVLVYAGYFPAGGQFKFVRDPGSWDTQMNFTNIDSNEADVTDEDGDNHNIGIPEDGFYYIEMNTATSKVTIMRWTGASTEYETITMPGDYQGWDAGSTPMTAMGKRENTQTHDWYLDATYDANAELKFANGSWDVNWGATAFPLGYGTNGGPNIPVKAGAYRVFFNDCLGLYYFKATE